MLVTVPVLQQAIGVRDAFVLAYMFHPGVGQEIASRSSAMRCLNVDMPLLGVLARLRRAMDPLWIVPSTNSKTIWYHLNFQNKS